MNMSYCRFQNTVLDLQDCADNMKDTDLSADEKTARQNLVELCLSITEEFGDVDFDELADDEKECDVCERFIWACKCEENVLGA